MVSCLLVPSSVSLLTFAIAFGPLNSHTLATNATHAGGLVELDVHNLFGALEARSTYHALKTLWPAKRPFIIGRSTFTGSGKWAGHWVSVEFAVVCFTQWYNYRIYSWEIMKASGTTCI